MHQRWFAFTENRSESSTADVSCTFVSHHLPGSGNRPPRRSQAAEQPGSALSEPGQVPGGGTLLRTSSAHLPGQTGSRWCQRGQDQEQPSQTKPCVIFYYFVILSHYYVPEVQNPDQCSSDCIHNRTLLGFSETSFTCFLPGILLPEAGEIQTSWSSLQRNSYPSTREGVWISRRYKRVDLVFSPVFASGFRWEQSPCCMSLLQGMDVPAGLVPRTAARDRMDFITWSAAAPSPNWESRSAGAARSWSESSEELIWKKWLQGMLGKPVDLRPVLAGIPLLSNMFYLSLFSGWRGQILLTCWMLEEERNRTVSR